LGFGRSLRVFALTFQRQASEGGEFAGKAKVAEKIGAVRRDLEIEENVRGIELIEGRADRRINRHDEQAAVIVAKSEFFAAAHHAERIDAAQFAFFDGESAGQNGTWECKRHFVACFEVFRTADDLARRAAAVIDLADAEFVGVRVLHEGLNLRNDDFVRGDTLFLNAFDFDTRKGEEIGELRDGVGAQVEMGVEPGEGDLHDGGS